MFTQNDIQTLDPAQVAEVEKAMAPTEPWEQPVAFGDYDLPPFPVEALPAWLRRFVEAEAEATQTPPDLAGMLALAVCAAAGAKKCEVLVRPGWREPLNLFVVVALPPGNRKSAVFRDMTAPLLAFEREQAQTLAPEIARASAERKILEARLAKVQAEAAKAKPEDAAALVREAGELAAELDAFAVPARPRLVADDCSPERLAGLLAEHGGRMAVMSPEGDVFDLMAGRYGNGPNFGVYLRGHAGDDLRVDRINRPPEYVEKPALTLGLAVQPEVLRGLLDKPGFRGRGLLARFLYSLPQSNVGRRKVSPEPVPMSVRATYERAILGLLALPWGTGQEDGNQAAHVLRLSPGAAEVFGILEQALEPRLAPLADLGTIADWGSKLAGAVARIAGALHLAANVDRPDPWAVEISDETMAGATLLADYLTAHAKAAFGEMGADPALDAARYLLERIRSKAVERFSKQEVWQWTKGRFERAQQLDQALSILVERGYIRELPAEHRSGPGRRPAARYEVNPLPSSYNSYNTYNSPPENNSRDIRNSRSQVSAEIGESNLDSSELPKLALEVKSGDRFQAD
ncbi:YfjI family protein [Thermodesulfitimonas autotrophica]|uniref:YfjI family protein n=1 Tax=Thermodesulfitimonas autotrophica TaxID=1894989 RepID=UPI002FE293B7